MNDILENNANMEAPVVSTKDLTKVYKGKKVLDGLSMNVPKGSVYGFIGKNGSGKTTTMRILLGLARPTSGTVSLSDEYKGAGRKNVSAVIENPSFYPNMTAEENMTTQCYALGVKNSKKEINDLLDLVGLSIKDKTKVKNYSLGMKQRLAIAMTMIGNPSLVFLDEPINGLDPEGIKGVRDIITRLNKEKGITVVMSSHILSELEKVATFYGVICNGKIVAEFDARDLRRKVQGCIRLKTNDNASALQFLKEDLSLTNIRIQDDEIMIFDDVAVSDVTNCIIKKDLIVDAISNEKGNYEEYFIKLMGGK